MTPEPWEYTAMVQQPEQKKTICSNCVNMLPNNGCKMHTKPVAGRCLCWQERKWYED